MLTITLLDPWHSLIPITTWPSSWWSWTVPIIVAKSHIDRRVVVLRRTITRRPRLEDTHSFSRTSRVNESRHVNLFITAKSTGTNGRQGRETLHKDVFRETIIGTNSLGRKHSIDTIIRWLVTNESWSSRRVMEFMRLSLGGSSPERRWSSLFWRNVHPFCRLGMGIRLAHVFRVSIVLRVSTSGWWTISRIRIVLVPNFRSAIIRSRWPFSSFSWLEWFIIPSIILTIVWFRKIVWHPRCHLVMCPGPFRKRSVLCIFHIQRRLGWIRRPVHTRPRSLWMWRVVALRSSTSHCRIGWMVLSTVTVGECLSLTRGTTVARFILNGSHLVDKEINSVRNYETLFLFLWSRSTNLYCCCYSVTCERKATVDGLYSDSECMLLLL